MKIALMGSHGVGKTTLCFELAAQLKRRNADVEMVREVARKCPLPINRETTVQSQEWILHTQIREEIAARSAHEWVICDRSVLDNYCYLVYSAGSVDLWERMLDYWLPSYGLLVLVPIWTRPSYDGVRSIDPHFQQQIELLLNGMVSARGLRPLRLEVSRQDRWCEDVLERLLPHLEPTLPLFGDDMPQREA
jgi:nicotinamide riboside kinase